MQYQAISPDDYVSQLPQERIEAINMLRKAIKENLPNGFEECVAYGMLGYVVPHTIYPAGYHCDSKQALPYMNLASQKNFIAVYHMGIYGDEKLKNWFIEEYNKTFKTKLDMGKSCMRFKKIDTIPYELIGKLASKITVDEWIKFYETYYISNKK